MKLLLYHESDIVEPTEVEVNTMNDLIAVYDKEKELYFEATGNKHYFGGLLLLENGQGDFELCAMDDF